MRFYFPWAFSFSQEPINKNWNIPQMLFENFPFVHSHENIANGLHFQLMLVEYKSKEED